MDRYNTKILIYEVLKDNLTLDTREDDGGGITLQLKLGKTNIGDAFHLSNELEWGVDRGHGGGHYVESVSINANMER